MVPKCVLIVCTSFVSDSAIQSACQCVQNVQLHKIIYDVVREELKLFIGIIINNY